MNDFEDPRALDRLYDALDEAEERERVRRQDYGLRCDYCEEPMEVGRAVFTNRRYVLCEECFWDAVNEYRRRKR